MSSIINNEEDSISRVLTGNFENIVEPSPSIIRIFLSSTFTGALNVYLFQV